MLVFSFIMSVQYVLVRGSLTDESFCVDLKVVFVIQKFSVPGTLYTINKQISVE